MFKIKTVNKLIVDIGNTQIKLFIFDEKDFIKRYDCDKESSAIEVLNSVKAIFNINNCIVSTVNDNNCALYNYLQINFNTLFFNQKLALPIKIMYKTPETLGQDRIAAACGASVLFPNKNILIIDAGSAITYDILLADKKFLGGNISPGLSMRFKALNTFTGNLPLVDFSLKEKSIYGTTTIDAIICGVQNGIIHEVKGAISDFGELYENLFVVFTGGDAFFFEMLLKNHNFVSPNLTAIGLNKILELNA